MKHEANQRTPGTLVRECMEAKGWTQADLAFALGTATAAVNQILNDKRAISNNMALALGEALDKPARVFAHAQVEWDILHADKPDSGISARARILASYPLREIIKRGWIDPEHRRGSLEQQVCEFFGVASLDQVPHLDHAGKKAQYADVPPSQLAWLFRARQIALEMHPAPYDPDKLRDAIGAFTDMRDDPNTVRHIPALLDTAGVRFVVVEGLPGSEIDGVCFWINSQSPVIGMSLRFDRIDNFWFVLRHECAHVLHGHGRSHAILDIDLQGIETTQISEEEDIANYEAAEFCVPCEQMRSFFNRKKPFFSETDVIAFSKRMKVHPGIAVGQLQRMANRYDLLRKYLVRIRPTLAASMMMDGWGDVVPVNDQGR